MSYRPPLCVVYVVCMKMYVKKIYLSLLEHLESHKTNPPGYPNLVEYRLHSMYTTASTPQAVMTYLLK